MTSSRQRKTIIAAISVAVILLISAFFVTTFPPTQQLWPVSVVAILLFSIPVMIGAVRWLGVRNGIILIACLGLYALVFETIAVITGVPYGHFSYNEVLGPKLAGLTPVTVLLAWTPLVLGILALNFRHVMWVRILLSTVLLVLVDAVLDPAAVSLGFWSWDNGGSYYGVPLVNFLGWVISGGLAIGVIELIRHKAAFPAMPKLFVYNISAIIFFWMCVNGFNQQWAPVLIGAGILVVIMSREMRGKW